MESALEARSILLATFGPFRNFRGPSPTLQWNLINPRNPRSSLVSSDWQSFGLFRNFRGKIVLSTLALLISFQVGICPTGVVATSAIAGVIHHQGQGLGSGHWDLKSFSHEAITAHLAGRKYLFTVNEDAHLE